MTLPPDKSELLRAQHQQVSAWATRAVCAQIDLVDSMPGGAGVRPPEIHAELGSEYVPATISMIMARLGNYNPHLQQSVWDALVRLSEPPKPATPPDELTNGAGQVYVPCGFPIAVGLFCTRKKGHPMDDYGHLSESGLPDHM